MSALPPKADIAEHELYVRFVPKADIPRCEKDDAIRSPGRREQERSSAGSDLVPQRWLN
jgi:hypothetical protein